ncbi:MAG: hypothetical protein V3R87_10260, partial [Dehalococcoidia bacterium]
LLMGTVFLGVGIYVLLSKGDTHDRLGKMLPAGLSPTLVMLAMVISVPPVCGLIGAIAGILYNVAEGSAPDAGLGSPNLVFTAVVLGLVALVALMWLLLARRKPGAVAFTVLTAFAALFGWFLPLLASWR